MFSEDISKKILYAFLLFIIIFILFNLKSFYFKKNIIFDDFNNNSTVVVKSEYFNITGKTQSVKNLFVNNKEYYLDENNNFDIRVFLFKGFNRFGVEAVTKDNKKIYKEIIVIKK